MRKNAFTLAELLIALAILGVIATFTLPKLLNGQQDSKRISVFKETVATVSETLNNGVRFDNVDGNNWGTYGLTHINAIKVCKTNAISQGCWPSTDACGYGADPGLVLANGAEISGLDDALSATVDSLGIDWNGPAGPNVQGDDQFCFQVHFNGSTYPPGWIQPYAGSSALYKSIFN